MELEQNLETRGVEEKLNNFNKVTPLSRYLAMVLFIVMPFIGGWIGHTYVPERVVEIEKVVIVENKPDAVKVPIEMKNKIDGEIALITIPYNEFSTSSEYRYGIYGKKYFWDWSDGPYTAKLLRVIIPGFMGDYVSVYSFEDVDLDTFEDLGNDFARDKNNVYYFGEYPTAKPGIIDGADPETFVATSLLGRWYLVNDKDSLFFLSRKLEGVNPVTATITEKGIIRDEDTLWFPSGSCHFANYRLGTQEEVDEFMPPC
jgi:hypothetical protein